MDKGNRFLVIHGCEVKLVKKQSGVVEIVGLGRAAFGCQRTKMRIRQSLSYSVEFLNLLHDAGQIILMLLHRSYSHFLAVCLQCFLGLFFLVPTELCTAQALACGWNSSVSLGMIFIAVRLISCRARAQSQAKALH